MFDSIKNIITNFDYSSISNERKEELNELVNYLSSKIKQDEYINLVFVCTHNSRRSQFSQVWAHLASLHYKVPVNSFSFGTEVTEANSRTISSLKRHGFVISEEGDENPLFGVKFDEVKNEILLFSKDLSHSSLPTENFAAIMTCSHADENCPFIPNCDARIPLRYNDPKAFDNTELEKQKYDERSIEIGTELFYIFSLLKDTNA